MKTIEEKYEICKAIISRLIQENAFLRASNLAKENKKLKRYLTDREASLEAQRITIREMRREVMQRGGEKVKELEALKLLFQQTVDCYEQNNMIDQDRIEELEKENSRLQQTMKATIEGNNKE